MKNTNKQTRPISSPDFEWLWHYFPLKRSSKEKLKYLLFSLFSFLFKNWDIYHNWKSARVYHKKFSIFQKNFWQRKFSTSYTIPIKKPSEGAKTIAASTQTLAIVIHAFYPVIFREITDMLQNCFPEKLHLYITASENFRNQTDQSILSNFPSVKYYIADNHGRDILPFIKILPDVIADGHQIILKLHTKGSNHLHRKEYWRHDLFEKLISRNAMSHALNTFSENPAIGMIGPAENILPMDHYYGSNAAIVRQLGIQAGLKDEQLRDMNFVAGSMFYARKECLQTILDLQLSSKQFEPETGQKDGTLAHAVERAFILGLLTSGLQLADTDYNSRNPLLTVCKNHYYTR